jgi:vancomycin resistance protein VanJ
MVTVTATATVVGPMPWLKGLHTCCGVELGRSIGSNFDSRYNPGPMEIRSYSDDSSPSANSPTGSSGGRDAAKSWIPRVIRWLCWGYLILLIATIAILRTLGDRTIWATILLFSPRWAGILPLVVLTPLALWRNRRMLPVLAFAATISVFPLMGLSLGLQQPGGFHQDGNPLHVVEFNVHHLDLRNQEIENFFSDEHPDIVALEELPTDFNQNLFPSPGWNVFRDDELCLATKFPITSSAIIRRSIAIRCTLATPCGPVDVLVVHLSSPHFALRDTLQGATGGQDELLLNVSRRQDEAALIEIYSNEAINPMIVAGDFNLTPDSPLFFGHFDRMRDSFESSGLGFGWTYVNRWTELRIDHVLSSDSFQNENCRVGPYLGSPHRPVIADLIAKQSH